MLDSAKKELALSGVREENIRVVWVPGSFEIPLVARALARRRDVDAVLCLGLVLKGETEHEHWVAQGATQGLMAVSLETDKPLLFGVLAGGEDRARAAPAPPEGGGGPRAPGSWGCALRPRGPPGLPGTPPTAARAGGFRPFPPPPGGANDAGGRNKRRGR